MNKITKGAIASAAGVALLLGGAGTFALWNGSTTVAGGTLATGTLSIASTGSPTWTDASSTVVGGTPFNPALQKIVPGDVLTLTQQVVLSTTGKNLKANFTFDPTSITGDAGVLPNVTEVLAATPVAVTGSAVLNQVGTTNVYTVVPGTAATTTVNVVLTITFKDTTTGTAGQAITNGVNLSALSYTLTQVRP
jgi:alternate signal-mediated exported protein